MATMNETDRILDLHADATVRVRPGRKGVLLKAVCGTVLVTQAGDPQDHVLERGMERQFRGRGLVVAWALEPARLSVASVATARPSSAGAPLAPAAGAT